MRSNMVYLKLQLKSRMGLLQPRRLKCARDVERKRATRVNVGRKMALEGPPSSAIFSLHTSFISRVVLSCCLFKAFYLLTIEVGVAEHCLREPEG
eukprot:6176117-Pleurochrysis_carterae.AAC.3